MALQDLPFFFVCWGAHISFLQDAIRKNRHCAETDAWLLTVPYFWERLVDTRHRITCRERGLSWFTDRQKFYPNGIFQDACPDSCARTIRATTYAAIFARFTSCTRDRPLLCASRVLLTLRNDRLPPWYWNLLCYCASAELHPHRRPSHLITASIMLTRAEPAAGRSAPGFRRTSSSTITFGGRCRCTLSIHWPGRWARATRFSGRAQPLRLEPVHLAGRGGRAGNRLVADHPTHRRITA